MELLIIATERLSYLIHRGAIYERLFQPETIPADMIGNLHNAMVKMYATVLRLMALCYRLFVKSTAKRAAHALFKNDVSDLLMEVDKLEEQVDHETQICEYSRSQEADAETQRLLGILREPILRTDHNVLSLLERVEKRERLEILDWMSKVLYGANHETVAGQRTTDTCEWLLNHRRFREWHESSASIVLWLAGNRELKVAGFY